MSKKIKKLLLKKNKQKIVSLTAYSKNIAKILDKYCDIILVGDSMANVLYNMKDTNQITIDNVIQHTMSVRQGVKESLLVVDMPRKTCKNLTIAKKNAKMILKQTRCDAVKVESNNQNFNIIKGLVNSNIPVMGHIGYTPQFKKKFNVEGKNKFEEYKLIKEAILIEKAGAFSIVLECITPSVAKKITSILRIPTIGIGSSVYCDGQVLVTDDLLGLNSSNIKFVKKFINLKKHINLGLKKFASEVRSKKYPTKKHSY